ncbi:MAG: sigma-70 family RNA polymerase sigma factor [Thermomicrobium sp.]|nr:sigma-70 family RNA polymerase sigma factor [Thermomicrobium sp.]
MAHEERGRAVGSGTHWEDGRASGVAGGRRGDPRGVAATRAAGTRRRGAVARGTLPLDLDAVTEGYLDGLARLARCDRAARDALYRRFEPFLERVAARLASRHWVRLAELDDVRHEGFVVFCELLTDWAERGSFAGYLFAHFESRLARALRRFEGTPPRLGKSSPRAGRRPSALLAPPVREDERDLLAAVEFLESLDPVDRALVELLAAGYGPSEAAARLGVAPRTLRRWLGRLRRALACEYGWER